MNNLVPPLTPLTFLRFPQVIARTGLRRGTIYLKMAQNDFPRPVKLGERAVGWLESEITAWLESRIKASRGDKPEIATLNGE